MLETSIQSLEFADTLVSFYRTREIYIENIRGTAGALVTELIGLSSPFEIISPINFPVEVPAYQKVPIQIRFSPASIGTFTDSLLILTNDPATPRFDVLITGKGVEIPKLSVCVGYLTGESRLIGFSSTRFIVNTAGPDQTVTTSDDELVMIDFSSSPPTVQRTTIGGMSTAPTRMSSTRAVVASAGADNTFTTSDDCVVIIDTSGGTLFTTSVSIPGLTSQIASKPRKVYLTPTSENLVALSTAGNDLTWGTSDDSVVLLDIDTLSVTSVAVGGLSETLASHPVPTKSMSVVVASGGADNTFGSSDDQLVHIDFSTLTIGRANTPNLSPTLSKVVMLKGDSFSTVTGGPNGVFGDDDDLVYQFYWDGTGILLSPHCCTIPGVISYPTRVTETIQVIPTEGPDSIATTADDTFASYDTAGEIKFVTVGYLTATPRTQPVAHLGIGGNFFISHPGIDGVPGNSDDALQELNFIMMKIVSSLTLGSLLGDSSRCDPVTEDLIIIATIGPDLMPQSQDDAIIYIDLSVSPPRLISRPVGPLALDLRSRPIGFEPTLAFVLTAGEDLIFNTQDDCLVKLGPIPE
jgi:hypothetical protein